MTARNLFLSSGGLLVAPESCRRFLNNLAHRNDAGGTPAPPSRFPLHGFLLPRGAFRGRGAGWQRGQKWLVRPATITRRIFSRQRKQGFPSRW
jgi:hypothetical protein